MKKLSILSAIALSLLFYGCGKSKTPTPTNPVQANGVTTYVGSGTAGTTNGAGTGVELNLPSDMVEDAAGDLYVTEQGNNDIRLVKPGGTVVTFAGTGTQGYKDGPVTTAEFNNPEGIAIDDVGNIYVADAGNNVIRKITSDGTVSTYAGTGAAGWTDGPGTSAQFKAPCGLAIDKARNVYVTDYGNNVIRQISSTGTVSTLAGDGVAGNTNANTGSLASFNGPSGITIDVSNNLYVTEAANQDVRAITLAGSVTTFAQNLPNPVRVTAATGLSNLYVSCANNTIQQVTGSGTVSTYAGNGTPGFQDGALLSAEFNIPLGLIANSQGVVVVCDNLNNRIRVVTP